jgi:hypothetical protein
MVEVVKTVKEIVEMPVILIMDPPKDDKRLEAEMQISSLEEESSDEVSQKMFAVPPAEVIEQQYHEEVSGHLKLQSGRHPQQNELAPQIVEIPVEVYIDRVVEVQVPVEKTV